MKYSHFKEVLPGSSQEHIYSFAFIKITRKPLGRGFLSDCQVLAG